jgi:2-methylcitrate dehydratase PrpD
MLTAAERLTQFAAGLRFEDLPVAVRDSVVLRVLDTVGCALAAAREDFSRPVLELTRDWGASGPCTVLGSTLEASPPAAALANGAMAHGLDFDDTHQGSITHASAVVVPVVLALGESQGLDGREVMTAAVAGYEAMIRVGMAVPGRFHARGWHATAVCGTFAAALAAARCLRLDPPRMTAALGIAASLASGVMEFLEDGSSVKRLHPGWAAQSGITAAGLARGGFTGPATGLDGRFGFYQVALGEVPDVEACFGDLGSVWETPRIAFKPYPCCHYNHAYIDAVAKLRNDHDVAAGEVEDIECVVPAGEVPIVCEPAQAKRRPRTAYDAKFSLPFVVASALVDRRVGVSSFSEERLRDPVLLALADRVRYSVDPASTFPATFPGRVRVRLRDGRLAEASQDHARGGPEEPLVPSEIIDKFRDNAARALPRPRLVALEDALLGLERAGDLKSVLSLARGD